MRAPNNYVFPMDTLVMTVSGWYQTFSAPNLRDIYLVVPKQSQRKGKVNQQSFAFTLELYISVEQVHPTHPVVCLFEHSHIYVIVRGSNQRH